MIIILLLLFGPALLFLMLGMHYRGKDKKKSSIFFILTGVYLLISLGTCGIMMANFRLH
ncbi:hypothetical protein MTsPCn9_15880 [Croceitalea sp. MTPC9]|nr:hypothetical protein MTsPCn6_08730 [Croceitalea sp. MTPC6]GMN16652.1 hypothetical protein MTsPCn9_15880 [Croceitalea sp. MTPC9]